MKKKRTWIRYLALLLLAAAVCFAALVLNGVILLNHPSPDRYPVRGIDVSSYQGEIDWTVLAGQGIDFAFLKATEGSNYTDRYFEQNLAGATGTGLRVGAYHFFSYDSPGQSQAEHFIATVPVWNNMLPPVIDVEFYGDIKTRLPDRETVDRELGTLVKLVEEQFGMPPILYATEKSYRLYLEGGYPDCDIWMRDVWFKPSLSDGRDWTFWQYTDREKLDGYKGAEPFIDMNVFCGTRRDFEQYAIH